MTHKKSYISTINEWNFYFIENNTDLQEIFLEKKEENQLHFIVETVFHMAMKEKSSGIQWKQVYNIINWSLISVDFLMDY